MKNNKLNSLFILSTIFIVSCATTTDTYKAVAYREDSAPNFVTEADREPANVFTSCIDSITSFFSGDPKAVVQPQVAPSIAGKFNGGTFRYPKGFLGKKDSQVQYGFESEYLAEESEALLKNYMPAMFGTDKSKWLALTHQERLKYMKTHGSKIFQYRDRGSLIKISEDPELIDALPKSFVSDAGHYEIVLDPVDSAEELIHKIKIINKHFGVGSMQVTISNPLNKELLSKDPQYLQQMKTETLGYYNFVNDMDTLNKLASGYERYVVDPKALTVKSFNHPWLGPMTKLKHDKLEKLINGIFDQRQYTQDEIEGMSYLVVSHKFTGGTTFRPDVAYRKGRIASEVRDCHQNPKCIEDRIIRETYFLMKGKESFTPFADFIPFDSVNNFKQIPAKSEIFLKEIFPVYGTYSQIEMQLYRNFSYPFRDWSKHAELLGQPQLKAQIQAAQEAYAKSLEEIAASYSSKAISIEEARAQVMGALGKFSKESGLADGMMKKYKDLINPEEIRELDKLKFTLFIQHIFYIENSKVA